MIVEMVFGVILEMDNVFVFLVGLEFYVMIVSKNISNEVFNL